MGLENPADLCFAFTTAEEAAESGGDKVASEWARLRAAGVLIPSAWSNYRAIRSSHEEPRPVAAPPSTSISKSVAKLQQYLRRTAQKRLDNPEAVRLSEAAKELLTLALSFPAGRYAQARAHCPKAELQRWRASTLDEFARMGPINYRVAAWRTWDAWCGLHQVDPRAPSAAQFRMYLYRPVQAEHQVNAPRSRWDVCEWLRRHIDAVFPTAEVQRPVRKHKPGEKSQAAALDPEVFFLVDQKVASMDADDPLRFFGLVHLLLYQSAMRVRHCVRSILRVLGTRLVYATCMRGKKRPGWEWHFPRYTPAGVDLGGELWQAYQLRVAGATTAPEGMFVSPLTSAPLDYPDIMMGCRSFLSEALSMGNTNVKLWTSYSARRALPSIMMALEFPDEKCSAAGHWLSKAGEMIVHYSATRATKSTVARLEAIGAICAAQHHAQGQLTWETLEAARHFVPWDKVRRTASQTVADNTIVEEMAAKLLKGVVQVARFDLSKLARTVVMNTSRRRRIYPPTQRGDKAQSKKNTRAPQQPEGFPSLGLGVRY